MSIEHVTMRRRKQRDAYERWCFEQDDERKKRLADLIAEADANRQAGGGWPVSTDQAKTLAQQRPGWPMIYEATADGGGLLRFATEEEVKIESFEVSCDRCGLHYAIWRSGSVSIKDKDEEDAIRTLRLAGWVIGASGEQDYCPECAASMSADFTTSDTSGAASLQSWLFKTYGQYLPSATAEPTIPEEPMPMNESDELAPSAPYRVVEGDNWLTAGIGLVPGPGRILVAEDDMLRQTRGGLHLPENASVQRAGRGTVLATGAPLPDDPPMPRVGQRIGYDVGLSIGAGQDGEIHLRITKPGEIILIYEEPEPALRLGVEADWRGDDTEEIKGEEIKAFEEKIRTSEIAKDNAPTPGEGAL